MKWKLIFILPIVILLIFFSLVYYQVYQFEHKYDDLPQVNAVPIISLKKKNIPSYRGPHPSRIIRSSLSSVKKINLGEVSGIKPDYANELQYPFICSTEESGLGQPLVDNQQGVGIPVYEEENGSKTTKIMGYSKNCSSPTRASYYYKSTVDGAFYPFTSKVTDVELISLKGKKIPFIIRVEMGTINRFIYAIVALKGANGTLESPDGTNWNNKLIYQFRGGVGIGYKQGRINPLYLLKRRAEQLKNGYAIIYSSANQTSNHYNIWLAEDTARRVKHQFNHLYGEEDYLVGVGGSGGAIQQYLIAQNNSKFLDASIALYSYPDMATQTIYVFDCELLEYYFDVVDNDNDKWGRWENRQAVEGLNSVTGIKNQISLLYDLSLILRGYSPPYPRGMSECSKSWRGVTQLVNNPNYVHYYKRFKPQVLKQTHFSHWEDLKKFYGVDHRGYARTTFDNVGVQYGLNALIDNKISIQEFLKLNAKIGGWKPPHKMRPERYWAIGGESSLSDFSVWSQHNMLHDENSDKDIVPRSRGSIEAMRGIYQSGHVFVGKVDIPIIDLRHYLDDELDMHHSSASFSTRLRIIREQGHADNQLIWVTRKPHHPLQDALDLMDKWLMKKKTLDARGVVNSVLLSKPDTASDRCYSKDGEIIADGEGVWNGRWNKKPTGVCMKRYPIYGVSRTVAGASLAGDTYKCALQSIDKAMQNNIYGDINISPYKGRMKLIFPDGVCDYTQTDVGRPPGLFLATRELPSQTPASSAGTQTAK